MLKITKELSYLLGLITGRGHFFIGNKTIAIEFSHSNEIVYGIAHCPDCGYLATNGTDGYKCKNINCGHSVDPSARKSYNQPISTKDSLNNVIIPFISGLISQAKFQIIGNNSMTILVIDFANASDEFDYIKSFFDKATSYDSFHIPKEMYGLEKDLKIEFINGLLDTSGFPSPGGWLNRDGAHGHGRMRVYFQVVRNWHLPVEIDNFLRGEFGLPIHNIDWGHPNTRDSNLNDFYETREASWSREHQVKFFPEYYQIFNFRIKHKQEQFKELLDHNLKVSFDNKDDWFPPSRIGLKKLKPYHPGEQDPRIPLPARKHFDAFWQINYAMGCKFLHQLASSSANSDCFLLTGDTTATDIDKFKKLFEEERQALTEKITSDHLVKEAKQKKSLKKHLRPHDSKEKNLYEPIGNYLEKYLKSKYTEDIVIADNSASNLNLLIKNNSNTELLEKFEFCDKYRIKPDIVGFLKNSKQLVFVEVKITPLDLKCLGQLLGYCLVAKPIEAILVSDKKPANSLVKILKSNPDLLKYDKEKYMEIGYWDNNDIKIIEL